MDPFAPMSYTVEKIDGDYAFLRPQDGGACNQVARALLPIDIQEGTLLLWENLSYHIVEE